jgi:hypothetical protein
VVDVSDSPGCGGVDRILGLAADIGFGVLDVESLVKRIILEATVSVKASATATNQNNTYKIKIGSTAVDTLVLAETTVTGGQPTRTITLKAVTEARAGGAVTVTHAGAGADAQVTSRFEDLVILGDS